MAEMERALCVLDAAILIVSCVEGRVQAHYADAVELLRDAQYSHLFFF